MTPRDVMIQTLRAWMLGDYGHDLPAEHFAQEVDRLLAGLEEFGFVVVANSPGRQERIQAAVYAALGCTKIDHRSPVRLDEAAKQITAFVEGALARPSQCDCAPWPDKCPYCAGQPVTSRHRGGR